MRARALRAPVFWGSLPHKTGRCAPPPPIAASLLLIQCAHPSFGAHCHTKRGAARPPPPIAATLLLIQSPKIDLKKYRTRAAPVIGLPEIKCFPSGSRWAARVMGFFLSTVPQRLYMKYEVPCPPIAASLIITAIFWGQNYVPVRPYALIFSVFLFYSFWIFSFSYSLLFLLSFSISSYPSLLISSYSSHRCYSSFSYSSPLIFQNICCITDMHINDICTVFVHM